MGSLKKMMWSWCPGGLMSTWGNTTATNEIGMSVEMFKAGGTTWLELLGKTARRRLDLSGPVKEGEALGR